MFISFKAVSAVVLATVAMVNAETHTIHFDNRCDPGTPTLVQSGRILSTGEDYTFNGPILSAIAQTKAEAEAFQYFSYLQTGQCLLNGEGCTTIEITLRNPTSPGSGSSADISLIPPHAFSAPSGFGYYNGCEPAGADCTYDGCLTAMYNPSQTDRQVACQINNVNLVITFCL